MKTVRCELTRVAVERRSSRTGQRHGIGGFIGIAEYEGDLAEFLPYLQPPTGPVSDATAPGATARSTRKF